jgi:hypothetical protein
MLSEDNPMRLSAGDFEGSLVGHEVFAIADDTPLTSLGYQLRSVLRNPALRSEDGGVIDRLLLDSYGDYHAHSGSSWLRRTASLREDVRSLVAHLFSSKNLDSLEMLTRWVASPTQGSHTHHISLTLRHLKSDAVQAVANLLQRSGDRAFNGRLLSILGAVVFPREGVSQGVFASTSDGVEIKWVLASHPDTPGDVLEQFTPLDLQWLSILTHPHITPSLLVNVVTSALYSAKEGAMDGGNINAALANTWWTSDNLRVLYRETPSSLREILVDHLVGHAACPIEFLEARHPRLSGPATIRMASLSRDPSLLEDLSFHERALVREAVKLNPATPEHARVTAALGNLLRA